MADKNNLLLEARPSWANFLLHLLFFWLIFPLIIALWKRAALKLKVYPDRIVLEKGVLSKDIKEIFIADIRTIDVKRSFGQRLLGIGDIMIATAGTSEYEDEARGLPDPNGIRELIIELRHALNATPD